MNSPLLRFSASPLRRAGLCAVIGVGLVTAAGQAEAVLCPTSFDRPQEDPSKYVCDGVNPCPMAWGDFDVYWGYCQDNSNPQDGDCADPEDFRSLPSREEARDIARAMENARKHFFQNWSGNAWPLAPTPTELYFPARFVYNGNRCTSPDLRRPRLYITDGLTPEQVGCVADVNNHPRCAIYLTYRTQQAIPPPPGTPVYFPPEGMPIGDLQMLTHELFHTVQRAWWGTLGTGALREGTPNFMMYMARSYSDAVGGATPPHDDTFPFEYHPLKGWYKETYTMDDFFAFLANAPTLPKVAVNVSGRDGLSLIANNNYPRPNPTGLWYTKYRWNPRPGFEFIRAVYDRLLTVPCGTAGN